MKFSVLVSDRGFPLDDVVTSASVYNSQVAFELLEHSSIPLIYGDKGYIDKQVKKELGNCGITLISQLFLV